jgi:DeoR family transcriptional regulator, fructose operon transcriptional repressor
LGRGTANTGTQRRRQKELNNVEQSLGSEVRLKWLEDNLATTGQVTLGGAATALGVSEMTIRRDLDELASRGTAKRVRGGAIALGPLAFSERRYANARAKAVIAAKMAPMVPMVGVVAFDASSTVMRLAGQLKEARDLTIVTNGPDTFAALQGQVGVNALLTGGRLEARTGSLVGPLACRSASQLHVECFFTSAAALDAKLGASEATLDEAEVKRNIASTAAKVVLAVDSSKLNLRAAASALDWDRIDVLVTDLDPHDGRLSSFRTLTNVL